MPTIASDFMVAVCLLHLEVGEGGVFNSYVKSHPVLPRNRYGLGNGGRVKNLRTSEFFPVQVRDSCINDVVGMQMLQVSSEV